MGPQTSADDPVCWTTYFATDDVAGACHRGSGAGGAVVAEPMAAQAFYCAVFGLTFTEIDADLHSATFATAEKPLEGLGGVVEGAWGAGFCVMQELPEA